jgi:hypothetical protein
MLILLRLAIIIYVFVKIDKKHIIYAFIPLSFFCISLIISPILTILIGVKEGVSETVFDWTIQLLTTAVTVYLAYFAMNKSETKRLSEKMRELNGDKAE